MAACLGIDLTPFELSACVRLFAAFALGALLGIEREITKHPAGLRTHILVSVSSAAFLLTSLYLTETMKNLSALSPDRVIQGVITGMGFIGAGTIFKEGLSVHGLTTAASLWIASAVGILCASGAYWLAIVVTLIAFLTLVISRPLLRRVVETDQKHNDNH